VNSAKGFVLVVPVLPAEEVRDLDRAEPEAQAFEKVLNVLFDERSPRRKVLVVVGQSDEAIALVHL